MRFVRVSGFVFVLLITMISATRVAGTQATITGCHQFNSLCRFLCSGSHPFALLRKPWDIAFLPGSNFLLAEDRARRVDCYGTSAQLISEFDIPLQGAGAVALGDRPNGSAQA